MSDDPEFLKQRSAALVYSIGDDEAGPGLVASSAAPGPSMSARPTPWFEWNERGPSFPLLGEMAGSSWFGTQWIDVERERAEGRDRGWTMSMPNYEPTGEEILALADEHGLSERHFEELAKARSPDDMKALARAYGERQLREIRVAQSATGVPGFLAQVAVASVDPTFLALTGGVGTIAKVGASATRTGNALRGLAVTAAVDAPLEGIMAATDPLRTWEDAGFAVALSAVLGAGFGALAKGADPAALEALDAAAAREIEARNAGIEPIVPEESLGAGASVGAAQRNPVLRQLDDPDELLDKAPEKAGFGRFGTPIMRLSRSNNPVVRWMNEKLGWDTRSKTAQGVTVVEAQRRIFEAGTRFNRSARMAAQAYFKESGEVKAGVLNPFAQPNSKQLNDFFELVGQVHAGARTSDNPHVQAAVAAYREGYEDTLNYLKNSSYNGPGSEGLGGLSLEEWFDIEFDPRYVMRRFSQPGFNRVIARIGEDSAKIKLANVIERTNAAWLTEKARARVEQDWINKGRTLPGQETAKPKPKNEQVVTPEERAFLMKELGDLEKADAPKAAQPPKAAPVRGYTDEELFGGSAPKTGLKEADQFYAAMRNGDQGVNKYLDTLLDPENYSKGERQKIVREILETEGYEGPVPQSIENTRKRLSKVFAEKRKASDKARPKADPAVSAAPDRIQMMREAKARIDARKAGEAAPTPKAPEPDFAAERAEFEAQVADRARQIADRISRKYIDTVAALLNDARDLVRTYQPMDREAREAAKEVIRKLFNDGEDFADDIEEAVDTMMDLVAPVKKTTKESDRARARLKLDLNADLDADLMPMFDWNAEALFTTYRRQLSGHAAFLKAGFTSTRELTSELDKLRARTDFADEQAKKINERETKLLSGMIDATLGRPPEWTKNAEDWIFWTTQLRRYNFSNLMGNTGFLSLSEVGGALTRMGPLRLLKAIPAYASYIKKIRAGDPEAAESMFYVADALMGHGSSQVRARLQGFSTIGDDAATPYIDREGGQLRDRINTLTRKSANATARMSGMAPLTEFLRSAIVGTEAQDWVRAARKGVMPYNERRMRALGVDKETWDRISAQLKKMTDVTSPDTGKARPFIDFEAWDDGDAANIFMNAIDRNSRRLVMEGDIGHKSFNLDRPSFALLFQFLNFPINAWSKHTGFLLNVRDMRSVAETLAMSMGGGFGFIARVAAIAYATKAAGEERDKYLAENLNDAEIAKAMFYYSAHATLVPNLVDLPLSMGGQMGFKGSDGKAMQPLFSKTRGSGLAGDPLMGNATRSRVYSMLRSAGGMVEGGPSEQDLEAFSKAWMPLGNHILTQTFVSGIAEFLPEGED